MNSWLNTVLFTRSAEVICDRQRAESQPDYTWLSHSGPKARHLFYKHLLHRHLAQKHLFNIQGPNTTDKLTDTDVVVMKSYVIDSREYGDIRSRRWIHHTWILTGCHMHKCIHTHAHTHTHTHWPKHTHTHTHTHEPIYFVLVQNHTDAKQWPYKRMAQYFITTVPILAARFHQ